MGRASDALRLPTRERTKSLLLLLRTSSSETKKQDRQEDEGGHIGPLALGGCSGPFSDGTDDGGMGDLEDCSCHPGSLQCCHRCQPRVVPVLQQGRLQGRGDRLRLLAGEEQLGHHLGPRRLCEDRQERGQHVRRRLRRQLSSCLNTIACPVFQPKSLVLHSLCECSSMNVNI